MLKVARADMANAGIADGMDVDKIAGQIIPLPGKDAISYRANISAKKTCCECSVGGR